MAEEATLQEESVSELDTEQQATNPRLELMERMREKRKSEMVQPEGEESEEPEVIAEDLPAVEQEAEKPSAPVYERDGTWYAKRKVNGVEEEVSYERLLGDSQKNMAADLRLEQAAQERKRLEQYQATLEAKEAALVAAQTEIASKQPDPKLDELLKKRFDAMLSYNENEEDEEAFTAYRDAELEVQSFQTAKSAPQPINRQEIISEAMWALKSENYNKNRDKANNWLYNEQKDVDIKDNVLHTLAQQNAQQILNERIEQGRLSNPAFDQVDVDPIQVYKDAVSQTKTWLDAKAGNATTKARIDRKRSSTGRSVTGSNARATIEDTTPKAKTQSERIADMRRARGQPV